MKNIYKICSFLLVVLLGVMLVGCSKDVSGAMDITAKRESIDVSVTISDPKSLVGTVSCSIFKLEDKNETLITSKTVTLNSSHRGDASFTSLDEQTEYVLYLYASYNSKKYTLDKQETKTTNSGVAGDPIFISTYDELMNASKDAEAYYELTNDIDCGGDDILPLYDSNNPFVGNFDGKGYTIKNFGFYQDTTTTTTYKQYSGLFGYNKGVIKNLVIENVSLTSSRGGDTYIGLLAGRNEGEVNTVTLLNCYMLVKSTGSGWQYAGGMIGSNGDRAKVINCNTVGLEIETDSKNKIALGGLIGHNAEPTIKKNAPIVQRCNVAGTIKVVGKSTYTATINNYIGGIAGFNSCDIEDSYADVTISVDSSKSSSSVTEYIMYVGGIAGYCKTAGRLINCAARADISFKSDDVFDVSVGGLVGYLDNHCSILNSYFITQGSSISGTCRAASYSTSTSTSDERYVKMSDGTYVLLSTLYYLDGEEYKALTSTTVSQDMEVYVKNEDETYEKLTVTVSTTTLYKYIAKSNAYASTISGNVYKDDKVNAYQTGTLEIKIGENSEYELKYYAVKTSEFADLTEEVLQFINSKMLGE